MLGTLVSVLLGAAVIKFFVALCGHRITWRLAAVIALLIALCI
jgi:hypothetical protein